jgi:cytochrome c6
MKNLVIKASLVLLVAALMVPATSFAADKGAELFAGKCAMCHGKNADATGPMAKKFGLKPFSSAEVQKLSDAELTTIIEKGKDKMPAYGSKLSADEIKEVVKYIRTLKK